MFPVIRVSFEETDRADFTRTKDVQILALTHVFDNPNWFYNFHSHDAAAEVIYIQSGHGTYTLDNMSYSASAGNLIVINPGVIHSLASDAQDALNAWTLTVTRFSLPGLAPNQVISPGAYPLMRLGSLADCFYQNFALILEQHQRHNANFTEIAHAAATTLLFLSNQLAGSNSKAEQKRGSKEALQRNSFALEVIAFIDKHFREPISLEMLSDVFHISAGHISHALTNECGISPINYLISRRIGEAQWLLLTTELSVGDIALYVGYDNTYHFSKLFSKRIGMRPQDFRTKFKAVSEKER